MTGTHYHVTATVYGDEHEQVCTTRRSAQNEARRLRDTDGSESAPRIRECSCTECRDPGTNEMTGRPW